MTLSKKQKALAQAYVEEFVFAALLVATLLVLDGQGVLPRQNATRVILVVYQVIEKSVLAGILGFGVLFGAPFALVAFAGDTVRRQILEHRAFLPFAFSYGLTTFVVVLTYLTSPLLAKGTSSVQYGLLTFLWAYSGITLITAVRTAIAFLRLVQNLYHLEKQLRDGRVP